MEFSTVSSSCCVLPLRSAGDSRPPDQGVDMHVLLHIFDAFFFRRNS